jgi:hypothetical protein
MLIEREREAIPDVPAVYFVSPTSANVKMIAADCGKDMYDSFHVNFIHPVPRPVLEVRQCEFFLTLVCFPIECTEFVLCCFCVCVFYDQSNCRFFVERHVFLQHLYCYHQSTFFPALHLAQELADLVITAESVSQITKVCCFIIFVQLIVWLIRFVVVVVVVVVRFTTSI